MNRARQGATARCNEARRPESAGRLSRTEQNRAFERAVSMLKAGLSPGAAFLIGGEDSTGQLKFLSRLTGTLATGTRIARVALLPAAGVAPVRLSPWSSDQFSFGGAERAETIGVFAANVAEERQKKSLTLRLPSHQPLVGGAVAFLDSFWKPWFAALSEPRQRRSFCNHLIVAAAEYEPLRAEWQAVIYPYTRNEPPGYERLLLLPELKGICSADLPEWLDESEVRADQQAAITAAAMNDEAMHSALARSGRWGAKKTLRVSA